MIQIYEKYISNNNEELQKIEEFSTEYDEINFDLVPIQDRIKRMDTLVGEYKGSLKSIDVTVNFYETDSGTWGINVYGFESETSKTLNVVFYYEEFDVMLNILKTVFLNMNENDPIEIWVCGKSYTLTNTDKDSE